MKKPLLILCLFFTMLFLTSAIDLDNLLNYANQVKPTYIVKDNTAGNPITNAGATLGRVLFYDKKLSKNNTIACASCHKQEFGFGDNALQSAGIAGVTGRHSMRLVNARFGTEVKFFWDERATSLENQSTRPIKDHIEMGFSGTNGDPNIDSLITKLSNIGYYDTLFTLAFGNTTITETRMQNALAQFIRSIQSFDSKFDIGLAANNNVLNTPFANFTAAENAGKQLFLAPPGGGGGAGCQRCHRAPEFDIDPNSLNNNIIGNLSSPGTPDITVFRAPSLRDVVRVNGNSNGAFMHDGSKASLLDVVNHYNQIIWNPAVNPNLDNRLKGPTNTGQNLNLTQTQKDNLVAFLRTLSGTNVYTDVRWSNPFDASGHLTLLSNAVPSVTVEGRLKVSKVDTLTTNEYVVVRKADGQLSVRNSTIRVSTAGDTLYFGSKWVIIPGISNANN